MSKVNKSYPFTIYAPEDHEDYCKEYDAAVNSRRDRLENYVKKLQDDYPSTTFIKRRLESTNKNIPEWLYFREENGYLLFFDRYDATCTCIKVPF